MRLQIVKENGVLNQGPLMKFDEIHSPREEPEKRSYIGISLDDDDKS